MGTTIGQWILDNYPWLAPTIVCCFVAWKLSRWTKRIEDAIGKVNELPCEAHLRSIEQQDQRISREEADIKSTNDRIDSILLGMSMSVTSSSKKKSPYTLTRFGEYLLNESHGKECVEANREYLFGKIDNGMHSTPYDVERSSLRAVLDMFYTDKANCVKDYIYNSPDTILMDGEEYKLSQNDVQVAMAIYLRDLYLEENKKR